MCIGFAQPKLVLAAVALMNVVCGLRSREHLESHDGYRDNFASDRRNRGRDCCL